MTSKLTRAARLEGEERFLKNIVEDMSDHDRKQTYADWLTEKGDPRGPFLSGLLAQWKTGEGALPEDDSFDLVWQRVSGVTLLQKIQSGKLSEQPLLFQLARPALMINPTKSDDPVAVGVSKFGGEPDLPLGVEWPENEGRLHSFLGQINFAELASTHVGSSLPESGLLSIFLFDDCAETGETAVDWKLIFTPASESLTRMAPPKECYEGNPVAPECQLEFEETIDLPYVNLYDLDSDYGDMMIGCRIAKKIGLTKDHSEAYEELLSALMPHREERSHLLGWSHPQVASDDLVEDGHRHLLTLASEETCEWCWGDGHQLYFSLSDDGFARFVFDNAVAVDG